MNGSRTAEVPAREDIRKAFTFRPGILLLQVCVLLLLVCPFVSSTFRDNDQATILSGSWQIAHHQTHFFHAAFYNFDKQWGTYLALSVLFKLLPHADPVLLGNLLVTVLASAAWISLAFRTGRSPDAPLPLLLPILLSPLLILYIPYLGTGWLSLALLLLAFFCMGFRRSKLMAGIGLVCLATAATFRGDVVLAVPALALSQMSRATFGRLFRRTYLWLMAAAAVVPVLVGKWMAGVTISDANTLSFDPKIFFGFLLFGLMPAMLVLLALIPITFIRLAAIKRRFAVFYLVLGLSPFLSVAFYSPQLYTLRYLFLTVACSLFVISSRRAIWIYRSMYRRKRDPILRLLSAALVSLSILPWLVGLDLPAPSHPRLTVTNPTRFPTGDGRFPMGGYLGFEWQVFFHDHLQIDHNQQVWMAARSVAYESCPDGSVPFLVTPMSNYLELAIRLQNKNPKPIDFMAESPCGLAYLDARSILKRFRPTDRDGPFFSEQLKFVSHSDNGQLIVRVDARSPATPEGTLLRSLFHIFDGRNTDIFLKSIDAPPAVFSIPIEPTLTYAVFSAGSCAIKFKPAGAAKLSSADPMIQAVWTGPLDGNHRPVAASCSGALSGWARTSVPAYMGQGNRY